MLPVLFAFIFVAVSPSIATDPNKALRFGNTTNDHITWAVSDLTELETQFSVCSWVRRWFNAPFPVIIHYYPHINGFLLGSRGHHNYVVGSNLNLRTKYGEIPDGEWFHVCMTWSSTDYTTIVYLNGEMVGSKLTRSRTIEGTRDGQFKVGNAASSKHPTYAFGGDLYKLNIFKRVLSLQEVKKMSANMCSNEEVRLNEYRSFWWEDIFSKPRSGSVAEIPVCTDGQAPAVDQEEESTGQTEVSDGILERLETTEQELAETKQQLATIQTTMTEQLATIQSTMTEQLATIQSTMTEQLATIQSTMTEQLATVLKKLENTEQELAETKVNLAQSEEKLQNVTESWNQSRWDVLFPKKFLNRKLTKEMIQESELDSTDENILGKCLTLILAT